MVCGATETLPTEILFNNEKEDIPETDANLKRNTQKIFLENMTLAQLYFFLNTHPLTQVKASKTTTNDDSDSDESTWDLLDIKELIPDP
jgi:hypothetical protein